MRLYYFSRYFVMIFIEMYLFLILKRREDQAMYQCIKNEIEVEAWTEKKNIDIYIPFE